VWARCGVFITIILPLALQRYLPAFRKPAEASCSTSEFANLFNTFNLVPLILLLALLIWAGTRPRASVFHRVFR
jgi:hypothetical protein